MKLAAFLMASLALLCAACARQEEASEALPEKRAEARPCTDLNKAGAEELMRLPGIGQAFARRIIEHRTLYGPFRRPEEIIIIEGFSERKYRAIAGLICVEQAD